MRKVKVLLPAYNEEKTLPLLLGHLDVALQKNKPPAEIFIINDGSTDNTEGVVNNYKGHTAVKLINHGVNKGLAEAVKTGLFTIVPKADKEDILIIMDADNTHSPDLIPDMVKLISKGCDIVIASRYQRGSVTKGVSAYRNFLSRGASILFRIIVGIRGVRDYTCGYRAYRVGLLKKALDDYQENFIQQKGFACMTEILLRLNKFHPVIREVPMTLRYDRKEGQSKMKVKKNIYDTLTMLFNYSIKKKY